MIKSAILGLNEHASLKISIIYFSFSVLWILLSDQVVYYLARDPENITNIQMAKGWIFILITTIIIFSMLRKEVGKYLKTASALRKSEERYRQLVETMSDGIAMVDDHELVTYVNDQACEMWGSNSNDIMGRPISYFMDDANMDIFRHEQEKRKIGETNSYELTFTRKDGKKVPTLLSPQPIFETGGRFAGSFAVITDISGLKRAEKSLQESENRYRTLFNSANDAIVIMQDNKCIDCNQKALEMFGRTRDQIMGHPIYQFSPPNQPDGKDSLEKALEKMAKVMDGEPNIFEWQHTRLNGDAFDAEVSLNLIEIGPDRFVQTILRDISTRKKMSRKIKLMQRWVEQSVDLFFWVREDSQILYVNQAVCHALGFTEEEFRAMKVSDFDLGLPLHAWPNFAEKVIERGSYIFESRLRNKNGQIIPVEINANTLSYEGKVHYFAYGRDITGKKKLESQLRQAQKLEAMGTLAGGIAHDFNNILSAVIGYTEIALDDELPSETPAKDSLEQVLKAAFRAKDLVKQILAFSRQSKFEKKPISLDPIVKEILKLIRVSISASIDIRENLPVDNIKIMGDSIQIHQVLMNLCTNAGYVMRQNGGVLEVSLSAVEFGRKDVKRLTDIRPGAYACIAVSDTGTGMAPPVLEQIFDPFFTTKPKEEGTGLGLSVVHGIVAEHDGAIQVDSKQGEGTTFRVYLPLLIDSKKNKDSAAKSLPLGNERIMVVDDEKEIAVVMQKMLQQLGYTVAIVTSSHDAFDLFSKDPTGFDCIITDQSMPDTTGDRLAQKILAIRPDMPIIMCSGFNHAVDESQAKKIGIREFILKPIVSRDLANTVRRVLDRDER